MHRQAVIFSWFAANHRCYRLIINVPAQYCWVPGLLPVGCSAVWGLVQERMVCGVLLAWWACSCAFWLEFFLDRWCSLIQLLFVAWDATSENMKHICIIGIANAMAMGYYPSLIQICKSGYCCPFHLDLGVGWIGPEKYPAWACRCRVVPHIGIILRHRMRRIQGMGPRSAEQSNWFSRHWWVLDRFCYTQGSLLQMTRWHDCKRFLVETVISILVPLAKFKDSCSCN